MRARTSARVASDALNDAWYLLEQARAALGEARAACPRAIEAGDKIGHGEPWDEIAEAARLALVEIERATDRVLNAGQVAEDSADAFEDALADALHAARFAHVPAFNDGGEWQRQHDAAKARGGAK